MDAIVLAGGKASPGDPLFAEANGAPKLLISDLKWSNGWPTY